MSNASALLRLYNELQDAKAHRLEIVKNDCTPLADYRKACERVWLLKVRFKQVQNARIEELAENVPNTIRGRFTPQVVVGEVRQQSTRAKAGTPDSGADGSGEWL